MTTTYPLSVEQAHLWTLTDDPSTVRTQVVVDRPVDLDPESVATATVGLVRDHEILRTTYQQPAGMRLALQHVHDELAASVRVSDGSADDAARAELQSPWDIAAETPLRIVVAADGIVVTTPALAADSDAVAYVAAVLVGDAALVDDALQYADYVQWQVENHEDPDRSDAREWWTQRRPVTASTVPFSRSSGTRRPLARRYEPVVTPADAELTAVAQRYGTTPAAFLEACWFAFVSRLTTTGDVAIAVRSNGRTSEEFDGAIGQFSRYRPVELDAEHVATVLDIIDALARDHSAALDRDDQLRPDPCTSDGAPITIAVSRGPSARRCVASADGFALELIVAGASAQMAHDEASIDDETADRLRSQYAAFVAAAALVPSAPVVTLNLFDDAARAAAVAWNPPADDGPTRTVLAAFREQVRLRPDAEAVAMAAERLTYGELDRRSSDLAAALVGHHGVTPGSRVGLCMQRSPDVLVGVLAIWKAASAYVPLNHEHPLDRLRHQIAEAGVSVVVADDIGAAALGDQACCRIDAPHPQGGPGLDGGLDALAYVMFTSGSTGLPKGVEVTQDNLANYCDALVELLDLAGSYQHTGVVTAISTDLGNTCIFPTLASGGCVELVPVDDAMDPNRFARHIEQWPLDVLKITPSHLRALLTAGPERVLPRRTLVCGGEALSWDLVDAVRANGSCSLVNHYGPTETTVGTCALRVGDTRTSASVPIGAPLRNTTCDVVDVAGALVPIGVPGELWIGGRGVAAGYAGRPEETAERFVADPRRPAGRVYRTGDRVRRLPDSTIEFLGRTDDQVKIRGHRVEPSEVEAVLLAHSQVDEAAVVAHGEADDLRLVAYVVSSGYPTPESLRATLAAALPDHMVPSAFLLLSTLPRTASGKVDRRALPSPDGLDSSFGRPYVEPRTPVETALAQCWAEVLRLERVGVEDDFFELGGHSLLAAQIVARVRQTFAVELPLHSLFTAPTVALLALEVESLQAVGMDDDELDELLSGMTDDEIAALLAEQD